jgi:hypothetical protein
MRNRSRKVTRKLHSASFFSHSPGADPSFRFQVRAAGPPAAAQPKRRPPLRSQTHRCWGSSHAILDLKHTLARYRTTRSSTSNTPLFDVEPPVTRPQTHPCSISNHPLLDLKHTLARCRTTRYSTPNTPLLDVEPPVTRPQTHPCSMSNYPLLDLKHTLARCRTSRSRPHFEASLSSTFSLNGLTISH